MKLNIMKNLSFLLLILIAFACVEQKEECKFPELKGEYFGQTLPDDSAILFAPDIISTGAGERDLTFMPDGKEIYFCREVGNFKFTTIFVTKLVSGTWTKPEVVEFCKNSEYLYFEPHISPDGKKFFFVSNMPVDSGKIGTEDIWVADREGDKWGTPYNIGEPINTDSREYFPTTTYDGTIYFTHFDPESRSEFTYRSKLIDGKYAEPEKVDGVNLGRARFNAFISPDESFIIIPTFGLADTYGATDYYIYFRNENDEWSEPINMGPTVNSADPKEWSPSISPDGKFFFFMSARISDNRSNLGELSAEKFYKLHNSPQNGNSDIYWVSTDFINDLKKDAVFN